MVNTVLKYLKGDKVIWFTVLFLSVVSVMAVYSSSGMLAFRTRGGNTEYFLFKHFSILVLGLGLMYATHRMKYIWFSRLSQVAMFLAVPMLIYTLAMGVNLNSANRWISIPIIEMTFQTSDFAKLALIMYLARLLAVKQDEIKDLKSAFLPMIVPIIVICGLILPANFSTSALLFITCLILMFIGRVNVKHLLSLVGCAILGFALLVGISYVIPVEKVFPRMETWKQRVETYFKTAETEEDATAISDASFQSDQAKIAVATGGLFGKGPGNSDQRNFLPHPYSDFIYAIVIEEYGLIGGVAVLLAYLILLFRGVKIVVKSPNTFAALLALGCCFMLIFQAMINMAVAVNLFPVTGQPLPLVSMGGTSLWFTSIAVGIILSVSRAIEEGETKTDEEYAIA
jgi:cell division protein FtsW